MLEPIPHMKVSQYSEDTSHLQTKLLNQRCLNINMIIAVTDISEYQYCPRKLYFRKVLKIKTEPTAPLIKGKIRHNIEEETTLRFNFIVTKVTRGDYDFIFSLFKSEYLQLVKRAIINNVKALTNIGLNVQEITNEFIETFSELAKQVAESVHELVIKHKVLGKDILKYIDTEQSSEVFIESKTLMIRGIVDAIEFSEENTIPIELKTGSMPNNGVWPSHKLQIGCYILLCQEKYPDKKTEFGIVRYLNFDEKREVILNPFLKDEIFTIRDNIIDLLTSKNIPDKLEQQDKMINKKCIHCQFKTKCYGE